MTADVQTPRYTVREEVACSVIHGIGILLAIGFRPARVVLAGLNLPPPGLLSRLWSFLGRSDNGRLFDRATRTGFRFCGTAARLLHRLTLA